MTKQHTMTDAEIRSYQENGYFIRIGAYGSDEVDALGDHVNWLITQIEESPLITPEQRRILLVRNGRASAQTGPASLVSLFRISLFSRLIRQHMQDERRLAVALALVGEDLFCPNDLYFLKPPGTGKAVALHQDSWYFRNTYQLYFLVKA